MATYQIVILVFLGITWGVMLLTVIGFNVMAVEAYREYMRLGGRKGGLNFSEYQWIWAMSPPYSDDPRREAARQKFLRNQKRMLWTLVASFGIFGIGFFCLKIWGIGG